MAGLHLGYRLVRETGLITANHIVLSFIKANWAQQRRLSQAARHGAEDRGR